MCFTVINMGRDAYFLERGGRIVTLLLFRLKTFAAHSNWQQRNPAGSSLPNHAAISRLSRDFVDVKNRAEKIANDIAFKRGMQWSAGIAAVTAVILGRDISSGRAVERNFLSRRRGSEEEAGYCGVRRQEPR